MENNIDDWEPENNKDTILKPVIVNFTGIFPLNY